jgi:hypothetical protein
MRLVPPDEQIIWFGGTMCDLVRAGERRTS